MCNQFAMFPAHLLRAGLSLHEMSVLLCLLSYRNGNGQAWPSRAVVSRDTGIHISHVHRAVKSLAQRGVIAIDVQPGIRTVYTFPCLDAQPAETPEPVPAPAPVVAKNAMTAAPEPVAEQVAVSAPAPAQPPAPEQPRAQQPAPAPVAVPAAAQEQKPAPAPMPALEPAPPTPRHNIVSARVARLPDVDEAVRREVEARPISRTPKPAGVDDALWEKCQRLQALCAENTARSREQKAAAQRFEDGVTAATEQVAKQRAAQDIAAARQRAAQDAAVAKPEQQAVKPEQQPAAEKTTNGQNADVARDSVVPDGCYPAGEKTNAPEPVAPDAVATAPIALPAPVVVQEPQQPAAAPQQGELLPVPANQNKGRVKTAAVQGELLPDEENSKGCRLPKTWVLPRSWGIWAMNRFGFTEDQVRYQADKFRDHWTSTTRNPTKKDWFGTWRNWMRNANERGERFDYNSRPDQQKSKMTQALDNLANMKLDWEHQETWNPFAKMTDEQRAAAQKREEARAAARIAEAARKHDEAKRNGGTV